jgi:hypothetical protein
MDPDANFAHPVAPTGALRESVNWYNPNGSADNGAYPHLPSGMLDFCTYSKDWTVRSIPVRITKAGYYWITLRAEGTSDKYGGFIDNFSFSALGGLTMSNPPSAAVLVGTSSPAAGSAIVLGPMEIAAQ